MMLRSQRVQRFFKSLITTTANPSLTMGQIRKSYLIYPTDKTEQNLIIDKIKGLKNLASNLDYELLKLNSIKIGLMQDLLNGKVRVNSLIKENAATQREVV